MSYGKEERQIFKRLRIRQFSYIRIWILDTFVSRNGGSLSHSVFWSHFETHRRLITGEFFLSANATTWILRPLDEMHYLNIINNNISSLTSLRNPRYCNVIGQGLSPTEIGRTITYHLIFSEYRTKFHPEHLKVPERELSITKTSTASVVNCGRMDDKR